MQERVDRALGRDAEVLIQPPNQQFSDLASAPIRLLALAGDDELLDLRRQLVGVSHRPARAIGQRLEPMLLVPIEDLVAGLARDAELATDIRHRLALQKPGDKPQTRIHNRTLLPGHRHLPPGMPGGRCHPCVRTNCHPCLGPLIQALTWTFANHSKGGYRSEACAVFFARDLGALEEAADRAVAEDEGAPLVAIDPASDNVRARRAYEKAGFRVEARVATESSPAVLMPYEP